MAADIGLKIGIDGEREYRKQLQQMNAESRAFKSELKELDSEFDSNSSAMDKNRKKGELLEKGIKDQEKRVEDLEKALENSAKTFGENSKETLKWKTEVSKAKTELNKMRSELTKIPKPLSEIGKSISSAGKKMQKVGDTMSKYVTAPLVAVGAASIAAFREVDDGLDSIAKKTGATGQSLEELEGSAKNIATTIPVSFEEAGNAVGNVNTKFGLTGKACEDLSTQLLKFAKVNDQDVTSSVEGTQKVMAAFGVETEDAGKLLDAMTKTGQKTGIGMDELQTSMVKNAAALKDMGLDAYQAADFLGQVETSGADTSVVMAGLSKALLNANEEGKTLPQALGDFQSIMNSTATDQEKLTAATELFGKKAGAAIYEACKTGSLSFESLSTDASSYLGAVESTFDSVLDPADDFTVTMNSLKLLGSEVGKSLLTAAAPALKDIGGKLKDAADYFANMDENEQTFVINTGLALAAGGPVLSAIGRLTTGIGNVVTKIGEWSGFPTAISSMLTNPVGISVLAVGGLIAAFNLLDKTTGYVNENVQKVVTGTNDAITAMNGATSSLSKTLSDAETELAGIDDEANLAQGLIDELAELENQTSLTAEQQGRMRTIVGELNSLYPELGVEIDSSTGKLNKSTEEMRKYVEQTRKMKLVDAFTKAATKGYEDLAESHIALKNAQDQQAENQEIINGLLDEQATLNSLVDDGNGNLVDSTGKFVMASNQLDDALLQNANDLMVAEEKQGELNTATEEAETAYNNAKTTIAEYETAASETAAELESMTTATESDTTATEDNTQAKTDNSAAIAEWASEVLSAAGEAAASLLGAQTAWNDLYEATKDSIDKQMGLFDTWEQDSEVTIDSMIENLNGQIKGMRNYASNMETLSAAAAKSSDPNFKAVVQSIAEMGTDGAAYAEALVTAMNTDQEKFNEYLSMIGGEGSREEAQSNLANVLSYVNNDFKTGMETGMEGASAALDKVFSPDKIKTGMQNFGQMVLQSMQDEDKLVKKTGESATKVNAAWNGAGQNLKETSKSATDTASTYTQSTINGMNLKPEVKKVEVPTLVTDLAKQVITNNVSGIHGKISKVDGAGTAGSAAKTTIEGKIDSMSGKVTSVSVAGGALSNVRSAISTFLANNPITTWIKANVTKHAEGGFTNREQLSWLSEGNQPEVVIPLSTAKRTRAMQLYQETGERLGVAQPTVATVNVPNETINGAFDLKFDAGKLYAAVAEGARKGISETKTTIMMGDREVARVLRDMGVQFA